MKASVIILSWNGIEYLSDCLNAVLSQDYTAFEVIVVDNGSTDGSAELVAEQFPQVHLIRNANNLGFAAGNNVGLRAACGDVLALLNQDTVVQPGWLGALVQTLLADPDVGIAGGKALYPDGTLQHAGGQVGARGASRHYGYRQQDARRFDEARDVDFVTGATLALTRQVYEAVGALDEGFTPAYFEDVDWCYRVRRAGFRVVYVPQAVLVHRESSVGADESHEGLFLFQRNRLRFVLKHWSLQRLVDEFVPAETAWLEGLDEGSEALIAAAHHAYLYHLLHLGDLMASRHELSGVPLDETDVLAEALLNLRTVIPLRPARIGAGSLIASEESDQVSTPEQIQAEILEQLNQRWAIREHEFRSDAPAIGPLIAAFRRQWNRVSTEWYVRPMIQQQVEFNALVVTMLGHLSQQAQAREQHRQRLGEVLSTYIAENGRELGELARQLDRLRELLQAAQTGE